MTVGPPAELLHRPIAAIVKQYGAPQSVATKDDGLHVVFGDAGATLDTIVDADGSVRAFSLAQPGGTRYPVVFDGTAYTLTFGRTTSTAARDALAGAAATDGPTYRVFRRAPDSDVALLFDGAAATLTRIVAGDRVALMRLGYEPDPGPATERFPYTAPQLKGRAVAEGSGNAVTLYRLDLDRDGIVRNVAVLVPSGDAAFDERTAKQLDGERYVPARLGGRTIGASVLREVRHS